MQDKEPSLKDQILRLLVAFTPTNHAEDLIGHGCVETSSN